MLDAFGKGASEDIRMAKQELYAQVGLSKSPLLRVPLHMFSIHCYCDRLLASR